MEQVAHLGKNHLLQIDTPYLERSSAISA